jgi:hypothetical protein
MASQYFREIQGLTLMVFHSRHHTSANLPDDMGCFTHDKNHPGIAGLIHLDSP